MWFLYNDQPPDQPAKDHNGHAKGTVFVNKDKRGFWFIHSVPDFPPEPYYEQEKNSTLVGRYSYPSSGKVNGQSFLCISTTEDNFNIIGKQLMYNQIIVYKKNLPTDLAKLFHSLADAANEKKINEPPFNSKANFYSTNRMKFISFAKSDKWNKGEDIILVVFFKKMF